MSGKIHNWLKNFHKAGDSVATVPGVDDANRIANILQNLTGVGCRIEKPTDRNGYGWRIIVDGTSDEYDGGAPGDTYEVPWDNRPAMYHLSGVTTDGFSISDAQVTSGGTGYTNERILSVTAGAGMTGPAGGDLGPNPLVDASCYVWLEVRTNDGVYMVKGAALPDIDAQDYDIIPLYFIPWDGVAAEIDGANIIDMRNSDFRLPVRHNSTQYMGLFLDGDLVPQWDWTRSHS